MLNIEINIQVTVCVKKMRVSLQMHMLIIKIPFPCFKFNLKTIFFKMWHYQKHGGRSMQAALSYFQCDWNLPCILPLVCSQIFRSDHVKSTGVIL